jgi:hypothetical protein
MTNSGRPVEDVTPEARHRGPNRSRPVESTAFWSDVRSNPRNFLFTFVWGLIAIGWGLTLATEPALPALARVCGAAAAAGGALLWLSYVLYLRPGPLSQPIWQAKPTRRRLVFLVRHLWLVAMALAAAAWLLT